MQYTWLMKGDFASAKEADVDEVPLVRAVAIDALGDPREAERIVREFSRRVPEGHELHAIHSLVAVFDRDVPRLIHEVEQIRGSSFHDPEGIYVLARHLSRVGEIGRALEILESVVDRNFLCHEGVMTDPWFEPLRERAHPILEASREKSATALEKFVAAGGNELLGVRQE